MPNTRFWIFLAVFQVVFGLAVFAATRHHYLNAPRWSETPTTNPHTGLGVSLSGTGLAESVASLTGPAPGRTPAELASQADEFFNNQQYADAAWFYQQAIEAGATDATTYNNLGITLHYLGRSAEALEVLDQGVTLEPGYQRIWLTLGFVSRQVGNTAQARVALTRAVDLGPDNEVGQSASEMLAGLPATDG